MFTRFQWPTPVGDQPGAWVQVAEGAVTTEDWQQSASAALESASPLAATLAGYAADCLWDIDQGYFTVCAYVAATAFGCASTGSTERDIESAGWHRERAAQASWLAAHLDLVSGA